jgi:hypothetical protein
MGKRKRTAAVAAVLLPLLGATAAAIAQTNGEPKIESVEASIVWTHISGAFRVCENSAGVEFVEEKNLVLTGVSTGHPRLSGVAIARTPRLFYELETNAGWDQGTLRIRDPNTNRVKVKARFFESSIAEIFVGSLVGRVRGYGTLVAIWRTTGQENGALTSQIGGEAPDGRMPAVIASGRCTGPFQAYDADIPAPGARAQRGSEMRMGPRFAR